MIEAKVSVSIPTPFPNGIANIDPIFKPVVSGTWSIELPLWTVDSVTVPNYVAVESLSLDVAWGNEKTVKNFKNYKLTGKYYAKGRIF